MEKREIGSGYEHWSDATDENVSKIRKIIRKDKVIWKLGGHMLFLFGATFVIYWDFYKTAANKYIFILCMLAGPFFF